MRMKKALSRLAALALALALLSNAALATGVDAPRFATLKDAAHYILQSAEQCDETIYLYLDDLAEAAEDGDFIRHVRRLTQQYAVSCKYNTSTGLLAVTPTYYPGVKITHAAQTGDFTGLTADEISTYARAVEIVNEARTGANTPLQLEKALHDWLCENVAYVNVSNAADEMTSALTAVGALLEGSANCQGFSDAFRLLGRLAGFNVRCQDGQANGAHTWNVIELDNQWYIVDVTHDNLTEDGAASVGHYSLFNVGRDLCGDHVWEAIDEVDPLASITNPDYFYYTTGEPDFGAAFTDLDSIAAYAYSARRDEGKQTVYVMLINRESDWESLSDAILSLVNDRGKKCSWRIWYRNADGNTYYRITWTEW